MLVPTSPLFFSCEYPLYSNIIDTNNILDLLHYYCIYSGIIATKPLNVNAFNYVYCNYSIKKSLSYNLSATKAFSSIHIGIHYVIYGHFDVLIVISKFSAKQVHPTLVNSIWFDAHPQAQFVTIHEVQLI